MKIPLLQGRFFTDNDKAGTPPVVLISAKMAKQLWGSDDALGKRLAVGDSREVFRQVVGIVGDVRTDAFPPDPQATVYLPLEQDKAPLGLGFVLRTTGNPFSFLEAAKKEVWSVDRGMPVFLVRSMTDVIQAMDWRARFMMSLLAIFSLISLLLAVTGIYAALTYVVSQQTREIGIRMALGAQKGDVRMLVVRQGMALAALGVGVGLIASLALTRVLKSLLFGVGSADPLTFVLLSLLMLFVALVASYLPARRATRVDPIIALRYE